jgi:hypothetical protein
MSHVDLYPPRPRLATGALIATTVLMLLAVVALAAALLLGGHDASGNGARAVRLIDGVAVGVSDTQAGALAAADEYVALSSQTVEQDPTVFAALVAQAYAPDIRARALTQAAQIRAADTQNMSNYGEGGRGIAVIAARRLDTYTSQSATVTTWLAGFVWGPHLSPRQSWNLIDTTLEWRSGRWLVRSSKTDRTPAPVPAIVYVNGPNDRSAAFARLTRMTAPDYGTAE